MYAKTAKDLTANYHWNKVIEGIKTTAQEGRSNVWVKDLSQSNMEKLQSLGYQVLALPATGKYEISWA